MYYQHGLDQLQPGQLVPFIATSKLVYSVNRVLDFGHVTETSMNRVMLVGAISANFVWYTCPETCIYEAHQFVYN